MEKKKHVIFFFFPSFRLYHWDTGKINMFLVASKGDTEGGIFVWVKFEEKGLFQFCISATLLCPLHRIHI